MTDQLYIFRWGWPRFRGSWADKASAGRKGQKCRVLAIGRRNSVMVEFNDGHQAVTSRNALMRAK